MADDYNLMMALLHGAKLQAPALNKTLRQVFDGMVSGKFDTVFANGTTVVSSSEGGSTITLAILPNCTPDKVAVLALNAIGYLNSSKDPTQAPEPSRKMRLRCVFDKAPVT